MRYIKSFSTTGDVQTAIANQELGRPYVAYVSQEQAIDWDSAIEPKNWFRADNIPQELEYQRDVTVAFVKTGTPTSFSIDISTDGVNWTTENISNSESVHEISTVIPVNGYMLFGNSTAMAWGFYSSTLNGWRIEFRTSIGAPTVKLSGDIMTLLADGAVLQNNMFNGLFYSQFDYNNATIYDASDLILPDSGLAAYCYSNMFNYCYNLTGAPALNATTLADNCYSYMFKGCVDLVSAPELPAATLATNCYREMFNGCNELIYIKCLATNISATNCTRDWVTGVSGSGTFVKDPNMTGWTESVSGYPIGWTVENAQ